MKERILFKRIQRIEEDQVLLRILYWFFDYPEIKVTLSELAKDLEISKKTASRIVQLLVEDGFLILEEIGRAWRISCNTSHSYNKMVKIGYNLMAVYTADIIPKIYSLVGNPRVIILFGSYRKGDNRGSSDVDIAVEVIGNKNLEIINI